MNINGNTARRRRGTNTARRRILNIALLLVCIYLVAALVMYLVESGAEGSHFSDFSDALWYTIVTASTVGYGDIYPVTPLGRFVGSTLIVLSVGFIGYIIGKFGELALESTRRRFLGMDGTNFTRHYVIIGWNDLARTVIKEMLTAGFPVAALTAEERDIAEMRSVFTDTRNFYVSFGLYSDEGALDRLNIREAAGAVLLTGDDTTTLITVLELKRINPDLKITAYIANSQLKRTVENAGVSYVISPSEVLGRMIASAAFEPDVSTFMETILSSTTSDEDIDLQEYRLPPSHELVGQTVADAGTLLLKNSGAQLITYSRKSDGRWQVVRSHASDHYLQGDDYLIVLANHTSASRIAAYLGVKQGRAV